MRITSFLNISFLHLNLFTLIASLKSVSLAPVFFFVFFASHHSPTASQKTEYKQCFRISHFSIFKGKAGKEIIRILTGLKHVLSSLVFFIFTYSRIRTSLFFACVHFPPQQRKPTWLTWPWTVKKMGAMSSL